MAEKAQTQVKPSGRSIGSASGGSLQRKCACGTHAISNQCDSCKGKSGMLQRKGSSNDPHEVPPIVHEVLSSPGQPLEPTTRAFMESRFGHNFSHVRVHTDARAAESANAVNALAYTVGRNMVFAARQYEPDTAIGRQLVAHELTHVVQQNSRAPWSANDGRSISQSQPELEREADGAARLVTDTHRKPVVSSSGLALQRQAAMSGQPKADDGGGWFERLLPAFAKEKELAPPVHYPAIDLGAFTAKPTLSLVGSVTYGPKNSAITISEGDLGSAMGGLAKSFTVALVKDTGGKKIKGVTFTSTIPGIGKQDAFASTFKPPLTLIWSSTFTPAPFAFEKLKVEGTIRVQLELAFEPKVPAYKYSPVPSPKPVVDLRPLALIEGALQVLAKIGVVIGRTATAPIIGFGPELTDPNYEKGGHKNIGA